MTHLGDEMTGDDITDMIREADTNGDGKIDYSGEAGNCDRTVELNFTNITASNERTQVSTGLWSRNEYFLLYPLQSRPCMYTKPDIGHHSACWCLIWCYGIGLQHQTWFVFGVFFQISGFKGTHSWLCILGNAPKWDFFLKYSAYWYRCLE